MKKLLVGVALGLVAAVALAQTYTRIPYLRVLNHAEILGNLTVSGTCTGCGSGGTPGGSNTQVQFNDSSAFGGDAGLTYNKTTDALTVAGNVDGGTFDGISSSDWARLSFNNVFTGSTQSISSTDSRLYLDDTNAGAGLRQFFLESDSGQLTLNTSDDAGSGVANAIIITKNASSAVTSVAVPAPFIADPGGGSDELTVSSGTTAMIGTTTGGASGGISMTPSNGTFSAVFDNACTVDQTLTMDYQVIGNLVILHAASRSPASCTSDTGIFSTSGTPVPAAIRPANNSHFVVTGFGNNFQDNGTNVSFVCLQIGSSGGMTLLKDPCNSAGSWTGSGTKGAGIGWHVAYMLGNP